MKYFKTAMITEKFRIIFFLLLMNGFMGILNAQNLQNAPEPKLSLSLSNVTLKQFFEEIQHKTDYYFSYREGVVDNRKDITVSVRDRSLTEILKTVLAPRGLSFSIQSKSVIITLQQAVASKPVIIKGKITDAMDEPLVGVTIRVKNGNEGATTDMDGNYSIRLKDKNSVLRFSYIGYKQKEVRTKDKAVINVLMEEDSQMLNEVVAIGYGVMRKKDLTGAVARLGGKDINNIPTVRLDQALTGKVSGVHVTNTSGEPGAATNILIRGGNSISASNQPLYVVDGFIGAGDLNLIDPNDIESIEILKDAAATSIYGARGANGVVIITTKRGTEGGNSVTVNAYVGVQQVAKRPEMLNAREYAEMLNQRGCRRRPRNRLSKTPASMKKEPTGKTKFSRQH
ncbi:TonB-dependent receptor plug domain-containing protein [Bacteroides salyersiae]|nr:TonB-dependent receptor plug domain-containing protein [Bacteroides salyersiae]